ncbi:hypothetical protein [Streptomyces cyaneofuscatus]|uniref:hypothetical protein n=1 Tax=Streptomyces cyaneofuscatus TaxID=66883 RepID=UPI00379E5F8C
MPLRTTTTKAFNQIARRDPEGIHRYRAELRYFHLPQRGILGMTADYAVMDEAFLFTDPDPTLQQAALFGPEFVNRILNMRRLFKHIGETLAAQRTPGHT